MFSLGFGEILVICVILILVVGPERLPAVMKGVGKTMRTVREASREIRTTVGLDELMRDDPPRPVYRPPPPATVARIEPLPASTTSDSTTPDSTPNSTEANAAPPPAADPPQLAQPVATAVASNTAGALEPAPAPASPATPSTGPDKAGV